MWLRCCLIIGVLLAVACRDEPEPTRRPVATPMTAQSLPPAAPQLPGEVWDSAAGPALIIAPTSGSDSVSVIRPEFTGSRYAASDSIDLRSLSNTRLDLFGRSGRRGSTTLFSGISRSSDGSCTTWPAARVAAALPGWRVALESGRATSLPLDSLANMSAADSAGVVARIVGAVAGTVGRSDSVFAGVSYVARGVYRLEIAGADVAVASLQRTIPSEADPRDEDVFVVVERRAGTNGVYRTAFFRRSVGGRDPAEVTDLLAAVLLRGSGRAALIVSQELEDGGSIGVIERVAPGRWRESWKSAYAGC